jgi:hypothetical protein
MQTTKAGELFAVRRFYDAVCCMPVLCASSCMYGMYGQQR